MKLLILQDRIINLENMICIKKYRSGVERPYANSKSDPFEIRVTFTTPSGSSDAFDAEFERFHYEDKKDWDRDWRRLCELVDSHDH